MLRMTMFAIVAIVALTVRQGVERINTTIAAAQIGPTNVAALTLR